MLFGPNMPYDIREDNNARGSAMDGEEFLRRLRADDQRVWDDLMPMMTKVVFGACYRIGITDERREDILQDVVLKVLTNWHQYQAQSKLSTWLYTIARNRCIDLIKQRARVELSSGCAPGDDDRDFLDTNTDHSISSPLQRMCVEAVLDELECQPTARDGSMRMIEVIRYCVEHGPSSEELARFLNTSAGAARERKSYIWKQLRALCEKHCGHPQCVMDTSGA